MVVVEKNGDSDRGAGRLREILAPMVAAASRDRTGSVMDCHAICCATVISAAGGLTAADLDFFRGTLHVTGNPAEFQIVLGPRSSILYTIFFMS